MQCESSCHAIRNEVAEAEFIVYSDLLFMCACMRCAALALEIEAINPDGEGAVHVEDISRVGSA